MRVEMLMPQLGESISEATILKWRKPAGAAVERDEILLEISTDKVDSEIPAPASGTLVEIAAPTGATVKVKSVIAVIETSAEHAASVPAAAELPPGPAKPPVEASRPVPARTGERRARRPTPALKSPLADDQSQFGVGVAQIGFPAELFSTGATITPLVSNLAEREGVSLQELSAISGTGPQGRITKQDLTTYLERRRGQQPPGKDSGSSAPENINYDRDGICLEPFDPARKRIAEHMVRSKATSPHAYTVNEVDLTNIVKWRAKNQAAFSEKEGFKLNYTPCFIEAAAQALAQFPRLNAAVDGETLVLKRSINVGCAVALGTTGLVVPVIKNADQLSFTGIARTLNDFAARARSKKLNPEETKGATFTVTNPGLFGSIISYPIISQPQLAILGIGAIKKRAVVVDDMIAIREMVYITLSYDHRVIDGALGGTFLNTIAKNLEHWDLNREF